MSRKMPQLRFAVAYALPEWRRFCGLVLVLLVGTASQILAPLALRNYVDSAPRANYEGAIVAVLLYAIVSLVAVGTQVGEQVLASQIAWRATDRLRVQLLDKVLDLPLFRHDSIGPGEFAERIDGDTRQLSNLLSRFVVQVIGQGLLLVGTLVALSLVVPVLGVALAIIACGSGVCLRFVTRGGDNAYRALRARQARFSGAAEEMLRGARDIRGASGLGWAYDRLDRELDGVRRSDLRASVLGSSVPWSAATLLTAAAIATTFLIIGPAVDGGEVTLGQAFLVFAYAQQMLSPIDRLTLQFQDFQVARSSLKRVYALWSMDGERSRESDLSSATAVRETDSALRMEDVWYAYPGTENWVLRGANLQLARRESLAVVGSTGAGKSTIARLLIGVDDVNRGDITVGAVPITSLAVDTLRSKIVLVSQETQLIRGTVTENIRFYDDAIGDQAIESAITASGLGAFISQLPKGKETEIGDLGYVLSAGEAQLVGILRAIVRRPEVLILDEVSSHLDNDIERQLRRAVFSTSECAVLVIAHREEMISSCDRVVRVEDGRLHTVRGSA